MLKKALFIAAGIAILGVLMFGSNIYYMAQDLIGGARDLGDNLISVENKIEHARRDIKSLDKDILSLTHDIAKEELSCEKLEKEVAAKSNALSEQHAHMDTLNRHLKESPYQVFVGTDNRSYTTNQVKMDLASSLKQYKTQESMLTALEKQLVSRVSIVSTAKERLEETRQIQSELMSELEALKAEHNMNEVVKVTSELKLDNSRLNRAKKALEKLETRIRVESKILNQNQIAGRIPTEEIELRDLDTISAQYEAFFAESSMSVAKN